MDRVIIKNKTIVSIIKKCGTCRYGKNKNLQGKEMQKGWVYCVQWDTKKPFNAYCSKWTK